MVVAKNKFYAVKNGRNVGIYNTWDECRNEVINFKGAVYKSFSSYQDAVTFISGEREEEKTCDDKLVAYVDGSYNINTCEFSYGIVAFYRGEKMCFNKKFDNKDFASMRNVAGEIEGAKTIMNYCIQNKVPALDIYYDYIGIENWALGKWKTNKVGTIMYKEFYDSIKDELCVKFIKVEAHSNNKYNDEADRLAKEALGMVTIRDVR